MIRIVSLALGVLATAALPAQDTPIVIAHRGASGYLPEHTLAAKAMAHAMRADYIEQDIVLTKDKVPVVLHDVQLDSVTNVASVFPGRARSDGRFYAVDFTLAELKRLEARERIDLKTRRAVYPRRFPLGRSSFRVPTLAEELELIDGLNRSSGRTVGIYPEIKKPQFHREQGLDISRIVLRVLAKHGYKDKTDRIFLQCFDRDETRRIRRELRCKLPLVQLLGDSDWSKPAGYLDQQEVIQRLQKIAEYADGIGPPVKQLIPGVNRQGRVVVGPMVKIAHEQALQVHPYTVRADALPVYANNMARMVDILFRDLQVDGLFTDFPDQAVQARDRE